MADPTTVHCPDCGTRVSAAPDAEAVACPSCRTAFAPWGLPTAAPRTASVPPEPLPPHGAGAEDLAGRTVAGRRLVRVIGRGGMGTVYEAEDRQRGRVAVKVLPEALARDPQFVARFHREAKVLAGLSHPHLVEVYERGQDGPHCWFVMEHVRGESLRRRIERGALPWRDALRVAREVLAGLGYAHGRGVVHRDLKPENVLFDDAGRARLVDFGLSRIVRGEAAEDLSRLTRTNVILGTYEYMAPEQRLGKSVDERADLYALGVILYEMLTGALPLGRFEAASVLRPGVPAALDAVVHRALAPAPKDRFPSAVAFLEALETVERAVGAAPARRSVPPPPLPVAPGDADAATVDDDEPLELRRARRHVEILAAADRVLGILAILMCTGLVTMFPFLGRGRAIAIPFLGISSLVLLVGGFWLVGLGGRLARLEPRARHGQIVASILMLVLLPPLGTAAGIYGLVVLSSDAMRALFDGRRVRARAPARSFPFAWSAGRVPPPPPPRARSARDLVGHGLVVWALAVLVATGVLWSSTAWSNWHAHPDEFILQAGLVGLGFTALWFLVGAKRTLIVTLVAAAIFALVATRGGPTMPPAPPVWSPPPVPHVLPGPTPLPPTPIPPLDDRGRGRGRSDR